ncbi:hypothetical protein PybrP1_001727 [[Pythium] brassicae (nom. inval.)]|nr:hypothetical protein PybrP1_001727 [[Pythium] brassicae (nom. inval.)]
MAVNVNATMMDSIPRLRWSPANNRFHYNLPVASEPGMRGFVLLQEFEHADSFGTWALPASERHHLEEMERINAMIADVENAVHLHENVKFLQNQRTHHEEEFHERDTTEEEVKDRVTKKKRLHQRKQSPKRSFEARRQKPSRVGRVHQPK